MRQLAILALIAVLTPWVSAQRSASGFQHFTHSMPQSSTGGSLVSRPEFASFRRSFPGRPNRDLLPAFGIFSDFYPADWSLPGYPEGYPASVPANFFLMPSAAGATVHDEPQPAAHPLMIELRGDQYVRVTNNDENIDNNATAAEYQQPSVASSGKTSAAPRHTATSAPFRVSSEVTQAAASDLPATTLIFRDGHSESVRDYAIADGVIYARGNYYTDGYWNKKIEVHELNVPETIKSNQERGVPFLLPDAPNEVITRP